jgi:hypothetical protein
MTFMAPPLFLSTQLQHQQAVGFGVGVRVLVGVLVAVLVGVLVGVDVFVTYAVGTSSARQAALMTSGAHGT